MPQDKLTISVKYVIRTSMEAIIAGMFDAATKHGLGGVGVPSDYEAIFVRTGPLVIEGIRYPNSSLVVYSRDGEPVEQHDPSNN